MPHDINHKIINIMTQSNLVTFITSDNKQICCDITLLSKYLKYFESYFTFTNDNTCKLNYSYNILKCMIDNIMNLHYNDDDIDFTNFDLQDYIDMLKLLDELLHNNLSKIINTITYHIIKLIYHNWINIYKQLITSNISTYNTLLMTIENTYIHDIDNNKLCELSYSDMFEKNHINIKLLQLQFNKMECAKHEHITKKQIISKVKSQMLYMIDDMTHSKIHNFHDYVMKINEIVNN